MALRNQPYLPLYIQDFLTDEKLCQCSAKATGVYIRLMCLMHKSDVYGCILLKQKHKQTNNQINNFACYIVKSMPYDLATITESLEELLDEKVLAIEGDMLLQKRMVKDNTISVTRSQSGKLGGLKTQSNNTKQPSKATTFAKANAKAKNKANTEYEYEYEYESENVVEIVSVNKKSKETEIVFPFTSEQFQRTWEAWLQYRKEAGKPIKSKTSQQASLKKLSAHPEVVAIKMIENSIANSWQGIFELDEKKHGYTSRQTATSFIGESIGISKEQTIERLNSYVD